MALAERTWELRKLRQRVRSLTRSGERHVDFGATLQPVARGDGTAGDIRVGEAWVRRCGSARRIGCRLDTLTKSSAGRFTSGPELLYAESQSEPLFFGENKSIRRMVVVGSMGSGKSEIGARWIVRQCLRFRNVSGGIGAPTNKRLRIIYKKVRKLLPSTWIRAIRTALGEIELKNGVTLHFFATKEASAQTGSPFAGLDFAFAMVDEEQDVADEALDELEMRGRSAPGGYYPVLSTCTLKDTPQWRNRLARYENQHGCRVHRMLLTANPFVAQTYIDALKHSLPPRAYRMRVLALPAPPERATYPTFSRKRHVRRIPDVGVRCVAQRELRRFGGDHRLLLGHDPGKIWQVTTAMRPLEIVGEPGPVWFAVGELSTRGTTEDHVSRLPAWLRGMADVGLVEWAEHSGPIEEHPLVIADPHSDDNAYSENRPDKTVYLEFKNRGWDIRSAAYVTHRGGTKVKVGRVPKEPRIQMMCALLHNSADETRFYLAADERGNPYAERLAGALEMSERDERGIAEADRKDESDVSHWPCSVGYALWPVERTRMAVGITAGRAVP